MQVQRMRVVVSQRGAGVSGMSNVSVNGRVVSEGGLDLLVNGVLSFGSLMAEAVHELLWCVNQCRSCLGVLWKNAGLCVSLCVNQWGRLFVSRCVRHWVSQCLVCRRRMTSIVSCVCV